MVRRLVLKEETVKIRLHFHDLKTSVLARLEMERRVLLFLFLYILLFLLMYIVLKFTCL